MRIALSLILAAALNAQATSIKEAIHEKLTGDHTADWDFIQRAGGIRVGAVQKIKDQKYKVQIECDLSALHDDLVVRRLLQRRVSAKIYLSLIYGSSEAKEQSPICPPLELSGIETGDYKIYYDAKSGAYSIGNIELK